MPKYAIYKDEENITWEEVEHVATQPNTEDDWLPWIDKPKRTMAPFRYFGGKGSMAKKIVRLLPKGNLYCEPFCGAASVFWHLPEPYPVEVLNDLDGELINVFRCLQQEDTFNNLAQMVANTPYARAELERALEMQTDDPVKRAWRFLVLQNFGTSGRAAECYGDWGRAFIVRCGMSMTTNKWRKRMKTLPWWHDRLTRVQIDNRPAIDVIKYWDKKPGSVFYVDPPYVTSTRKGRKYTHEMTDADHNELIEVLLRVKGVVVLSGYDSSLYSPLEGWHKITHETIAYSAASVNDTLQGEGARMASAKRTECIWVNRPPEQGILL